MQEFKRSVPAKSIASLLAVVVIYKLPPRESTSFRTLLEAANQISSTTCELGILIWDNTPSGQIFDKLPERVRYEAAPDNPGLAQAYNRALEIAISEGYDWLLTLDQDTILPSDFLVRIEKLANSFESSPTVAAIVPRVMGDGRNLSPFKFIWGILPRWFASGFIGVSKDPTYAINSASTFRVAALKQIGGYDPVFPLDLSDINLFHQLHLLGKEVFVAGDILVHHELALLRKHQRMSIERYSSGLLDECAFWDLNMGRLARLERMVRLAGRVCRDFLKPGEPAFRRVTLRELKRRLVVPRALRIAEWSKWAEARSARPSVTEGVHSGSHTSLFDHHDRT
jgi:GT2 family glycosyltransferase